MIFETQISDRLVSVQFSSVLGVPTSVAVNLSPVVFKGRRRRRRRRSETLSN